FEDLERMLMQHIVRALDALVSDGVDGPVVDPRGEGKKRCGQHQRRDQRQAEKPNSSMPGGLHLMNSKQTNHAQGYRYCRQNSQMQLTPRNCRPPSTICSHRAARHCGVFRAVPGFFPGIDLFSPLTTIFEKFLAIIAAARSSYARGAQSRQT